MWPFDRMKRNQKSRDRPERGLRVPVGRVRGDYSLTTSEAIYSAVGRISNTIGMLPLHLFKGDVVATEHPLEKLLSYMPNKHMTPFIFQQTMEVFRNTEGNAYALMVPSDDGLRVQSLDVLDAARVVPYREKTSREMWYQLAGEGEPLWIHSSQMIVLQHMSANGEKGIRPLDVLRGTLNYDASIKEFSLQQLEGVNSGVALTVPGTGLSPDRKEGVIKQFLEAYSKSKGRVVVLEGGITATTLSQSPVDARVLDVERISKNRVATVYNLPPHLLGDYSDTSYSTAEQTTQEYRDLCILPIVTQWEQQLDLKLLSWEMRKDGYRCRFDLAQMQRADVRTTADKHQKAIRGGWMRPNEVRRIEGLPPDPHGDELMISRDMVPLKTAQIPDRKE